MLSSYRALYPRPEGRGFTAHMINFFINHPRSSSVQRSYQIVNTGR